jgi:NodT family efflux transporter outer membrane factor (OMF) lipoprotein
MKKPLYLLIVLAGCRGAYKAPDVAMSGQFITQEATLNYKSFQPRFWELLNDPTLNRLAGLVESSNFDILQAKEQIAQLRAQYRFQTSQLFPQIGAFGSTRRERDTQTLTYSQFTGTVLQSIYQLGFDASWEVDLFGVQLAAKQGAFFTMMSQVEQAALIKLSFVSELVLQYVNLRHFQALVRTYTEELKVLEEIQDLSQNRFGSGLNDQTTALLNLSRIQDKQAQIEKTAADIDKLIFLITQLTGKFPEAEYQSLKQASCLEGEIPLIYPDIPSDIVLARPDVAAARYQLFAAQAALKKAYRDFFPQFNITSAYGVLSNFPQVLFKKPSLQWDIMPGFNVTLIDFGALIAEKNAAKSGEKQALYAYENSLVKAFSEIETALSGVKATNLQVKSLEEELITLKEKTADFSERFKVGLIEKTQVLESYLEELYLEELILKAVNDRYGFVISFYKAIGVRL